MDSECISHKLNLAVRRNDVMEVRMILNCSAVDFKMMGDEGNILNVAIENAGVDVLAELLGVVLPLKEERISLSNEKYSLVNSSCDSNGLTPLMKAAACGKYHMITLLLSCGAKVNDKTPEGKAAIDLSRVPEVVLPLFEHDSLFPHMRLDSKIKEFQSFISVNDKLKDLFQARDDIHGSVKRGVFDSEIRAAFELGKWVYHVNSEGRSILYTAGINRNYDAWAFLLDQGMQYANHRESEDVNEMKSYHGEMFERALERLYFPIKGCHVMKLVSRSMIFGSMRNERDFGSRVLGFFRHLDEDEITSTLMQVLQDVPGLQIAFDFDTAGVERMRVACSARDRGLTDFEKNRICVGAKEMDDFGFPEIVSNLAHELCHMALWVVFRNEGLPYFQGRSEEESGYEKVQEEIFNPLRFKSCDEIIRRVKKYPEIVHGRELIVRVPEMIAKYHKSESDGFNRLTAQASELLDYYEQYVQPELQKYIDGISTSNMITRRGLMVYQKLLTAYQKDWIQVCEPMDKDIKDFAGKHNGLMVIKASNVKLLHSHLSLSFQRDGKVTPMFVDWSLYLNCRDLLIKGLKSREIETLAISWDLESPPKFCDRQSCWKETCPAHDFTDVKECVVILLGSEWPVLKGSRTLEYIWDDLSQETKQVILKRKVKFGGKSMLLQELICKRESGGDFENFMKEHLDSSDLTLLLEEKNVILGKPSPWMSKQDNNIIMKHPGCFIPRTLVQKYVELHEDTLRLYGNDVFFVSNVDTTYLSGLGIKEKYVGQRDYNSCDGHVRCYVFDPKTDERNEEAAFQEVYKHVRSLGYAQMLHFLKLRQGKFALIRSSKCGSCYEDNVNAREGLLSSCCIKNLLEISTFQGADVVMVADDPGTGKTIYLNHLAKEIKKNHPKKWISLIDLSLQEQQNHLINWAKSSPSSVGMIDWLFQMVKGGSCALEKKLFQDYCQRVGDVMVMFDGFDEICPKYKTAITSFLVSLKKFNSNIKLFVSTRLHEKCDLEESLGAISYQLIPFNNEDQITFLNEYWNALLKNLPFEERLEKMESFVVSVERWVVEENDVVTSSFTSEIKEVLSKSKSEPKHNYRRLDFKPVAKRLVLGQDTFFEGLDRFTETPLHVQMVAAIIFEDSLNVRKTMNLGHLYQRFYDLKMKIFGREKAHDSGNVHADNLIKMGQKKTTRTLEEFSANLLLDKKLYVPKVGDIGDMLSVGLVSIQDGAYQFVHRTFAEFFFARWMLTEAGTDHVTKLWLQRILVDDGLARVRDFLEDILSLLMEGVIAFEEAGDVLMLDKLEMTSSVFHDAQVLSEMNIAIYALILHSNPQILQYFVDSFGDRVPRALIQGLDCKKWHVPDGSGLAGAIKRYLEFEWTRNKFGNAFSFASHCIERQTKLTPSKYMKVVEKMLDLVEQFNLLEEMHALVVEKGLKWLFPNYFVSGDGSLTYNTKVVSFLIEHKGIFGGVLGKGFSSAPEKEMFQTMGINNFDILTSMVSRILDESECTRLLMKEDIFFQVWINTVSIYGLERMKQVWDFIKARLVDKKHRLNYLVWKDLDEMNALAHSAYYEQPEVLEFMWELAGDLMDSQERKCWLFESLGSGDLSSPVQYFNWGFHKFLSNLASKGYLSGDETFDLLMSKDDCGQCYILRDYPYGLFNTVLPINHHLPRDSFVNIIDEMDCFYYAELWMHLKSSNPVNEDLRETVERIFDEVRSRDSHNLTDPLFEDQNEHLVDLYGKFGRRIRADRFKYFVAVFREQVKLDRDHLGQEGLLRRLKGSEKLPPQYGPNLLHHVVYYCNPLPFGYICSVLVQFLSPEDVLELLFQPDDNGDTILHVTTGEMFCDSWGKFYDVARALLGEDALWKVHAQANGKGFCVQDLFFQEEEEANMKEEAEV